MKYETSARFAWQHSTTEKETGRREIKDVSIFVGGSIVIVNAWSQQALHIKSIGIKGISGRTQKHK